MAGSAPIKILIAYEGFEKFAAIIRSQEMSERGTAQLKSQFDRECGSEKSDWPGHPHLWEQAAKLRKIIDSGESCLCRNKRP